MTAVRGGSGSDDQASREVGLHASIMVRRGTFSLELELAVAPGEVLALLGPNGAGKTTALRALAGLVPVTAGMIKLAGRVLDDPSGRTTCSFRTSLRWRTSPSVCALAACLGRRPELSPGTG